MIFNENLIKISIALIGSTVISSLITGYLNKKNNDKNNSLKYITDERKNWRKFIRNQITEICTSQDLLQKDKLICELELNLNPNDEYDIKLINTAREYLLDNSINSKEKLLRQSSNLLKHDWERSKKESILFISPVKISIITFLIYIYIKFFINESPLINRLTSVLLFKGLFSKTFIFIWTLCLIYYVVIIVISLISKCSFIKSIKLCLFDFLQITYRKDYE